MIQKALYEHLITEKLEQLPVPDMADAIWARIENQLDLDMPAGGDNDLVPEGPPGGGISGPSLLFVAIIAVMSLFTIPQKKIQNPEPATHLIQTVIPTTIEKPPPDKNAGTGTKKQNAQPAILQPTQDTSLDIGAAVPEQDTGTGGNGWVQAAPPLVTPLEVDTVASKRNRGVTGIGDNDYRIVPRKDRSGKN